MAQVVAQHNRLPPPATRLTPTDPPDRPDQEPTGKAGQTSGPTTPTICNTITEQNQTIKSLHHPLRRWIEAKTRPGNVGLVVSCRAAAQRQRGPMSGDTL